MTDALRTDFAPLLDIRRAAVVGASDRGLGYTLIENLSAHGGDVVGIHPTRETAGGKPCVPSIHELPWKPDVVAIGLGARTIVGALDEAIAADPTYADARVFRAILERNAGQFAAAQADLAAVDMKAIPAYMTNMIDSVRKDVAAGLAGTTTTTVRPN